MPTTWNLAILIFDEVEVLDFCGPFEVFSVASRFADPPAFHVFTVAEKAGPVLTRGGLSVNPHHRPVILPREAPPRRPVHPDRRFVDNGRVVCSAGIAARIDMSLPVVARL